MLTESFSLITEKGEHCDCKIISLDHSHFEEVYALDMQAFRELDGQYIEKNEAFIKACLYSECSIGISEKGKLIAILTVDLEKINDKKRASILGFKAHYPTFIGFIEGVYVSPRFRKCGLATKLYFEAIQRLGQKGIQHIYSAIDPRNYTNIIAMTKSKFVLKNLYYSNLNGDLRYLVKYNSDQPFLIDTQCTVSITDHDTQRVYFEKNYVGVHVIMKNSELGMISGNNNELIGQAIYITLMKEMTKNI